MRLLFVVAYYLPEIGSAAHIYHDLAKFFVERGHSVDIITSYPRGYNLDETDKNKSFPLDEYINGVHVHRVTYAFSKRDNNILRGIEQFRLPAIYFKRYKKLNCKFDAALIYIPPLPLYRFGKKIRDFNGVPFVLNYQDIHPLGLVDCGHLKNPFLIKYMEKMEMESYAAADYLTAISPKQVAWIGKKSGRKANCIFNSVDVDKLKGEDFKGNFKEKEGILGKTLVTYVGILSPAQGVEELLDGMKKLQDHDDIVFYIVGDGMQKKKIKERIIEENIQNVQLLPLQPRNKYYNILYSSDINIVSLSKDMKMPCIPGKFKDLLLVEKPIIAKVPRNHDVAEIIEKTNCGIWVDPNKPEDFSKVVLQLKNDRDIKLTITENGRKLVKSKMNLNKNVKKYEEIFRKIV